MPGYFYALAVVATIVWLLSCAASLCSLLLNVRARTRWKAALVCSAIGIAIAYLGWSRINLTASQSANGHEQWSLNSKWFFLAALVLGCISLVPTFLNWRKARLLPPVIGR